MDKNVQGVTDNCYCNSNSSDPLLASPKSRVFPGRATECARVDRWGFGTQGYRGAALSSKNELGSAVVALAHFSVSGCGCEGARKES